MDITVEKYIPTTVPDGAYPGRLERINEHEHPKYGTQLRWEFVITAPGIDGLVKVIGFTSKKLGPKTKLREWLEAFGIKFEEVGRTVRLNDLIGKEVLVRVKQAERAGVTYSNVDGLEPTKGLIVTLTEDDGEPEPDWDAFPDE